MSAIEIANFVQACALVQCNGNASAPSVRAGTGFRSVARTAVGVFEAVLEQPQAAWNPGDGTYPQVAIQLTPSAPVSVNGVLSPDGTKVFFILHNAGTEVDIDTFVQITVQRFPITV